MSQTERQTVSRTERQTIEFFVAGRAQPAGSKRAFITKNGRAVVVDANAKAGDWKNDVRLHAQMAMQGREPAVGSVVLWFCFEMQRPKSHYNRLGTVKERAPGSHTGKPDALKMARGVEDSLSGVVYKDDSQVESMLISKQYGDIPGVRVWARWETEAEPES